VQIQLNTDKNVQGDESLADWAERELKTKLARHQDHVTRIEVHMSDASPTRHGANDKICKLEARIAGRQPITVSDEAASVAEAFHGALDKLLRVLDKEMARGRESHARESIRGVPEPD
jgi:ribosome-associated translation inhibitor RaiA